MRIIGWDVLRQMVPWSRMHIYRLEKDGKFPKRVQLGPNRVGWVYDEIVAYIKALVAKRDTSDTPEKEGGDGF